MKLAANAYAIGPSLHDWEREEWEEKEEMKRDREEERLNKDFNADFRVWEMFAYCDRYKESGKADIEDKMSNALNMIANDEKSRQRFNWLLFSAYCSGGNHDDLNLMIRSYLKTAYKKEWTREAA